MQPSPAGRTPSFSGMRFSDIHPRVRETMRALCSSAMTCPSTLIREPRKCSRAPVPQRERPSFSQRSFLKDGPDTIWFPWTGSRIQRTLVGLGKLVGGLHECRRKVSPLKIEKMTENGDPRSLSKGPGRTAPSAMKVANELRRTRDGEVRVRFCRKTYKHWFSPRITSILKGLSS